VPLNCGIKTFEAVANQAYCTELTDRLFGRKGSGGVDSFDPFRFALLGRDSACSKAVPRPRRCLQFGIVRVGEGSAVPSKCSTWFFVLAAQHKRLLRSQLQICWRKRAFSGTPDVSSVVFRRLLMVKDISSSSLSMKSSSTSSASTSGSSEQNGGSAEVKTREGVEKVSVEGNLSKDAAICLRLIDGCLASTSAAADVLKQCASCNVTTLSMTLTMCSSSLAGVCKPMTASVFVADAGFQSWALVLFELLTRLKLKLEHCALHGTLELAMKGPRLRLFFLRLDEQLARHLALLEPFLNLSSKEEAKLMKDFGEGPSSHDEMAQHSKAFKTRLQEELRQGCGMLEVNHLIDDEEGKNWWISEFGRHQYAVSWSEFFRGLENFRDDKVQEMVRSEETVDAFKRALCPQKRKGVTVHQLSEFLFCYGPGIRVGLIQLMASKKSVSPWFASALTLEEAQCILTPHQCGTFLIRFSESSTCTWAVSYMNESTGIVNHALVKGYTSSEHSPSRFVCGNATYSSFQELVEVNASQLQKAAPNIKNLGPARYFRDFLSFEDAEAMLEDRAPGNFLIRFSQGQDGCLVVAYVTESNHVAQSKIFTDADKGFILGGKIYPRISSLVRDNSGKLKYPLAFKGLAFNLSDPNEDLYDETTASNHSDDSDRYISLLPHSDCQFATQSTYLDLGPHPQPQHVPGWTSNDYGYLAPAEDDNGQLQTNQSNLASDSFSSGYGSYTPISNSESSGDPYGPVQ